MWMMIGKGSLGHSLYLVIVWSLVLVLTRINGIRAESRQQKFVSYTSSSYSDIQLNLTLYDKEESLTMNVWKNPVKQIENFLSSKKDPQEPDWDYKREYFNILLQAYRSLQAYQTQRFVLDKDVITTTEFSNTFSHEHVETASSITLSYIVDFIASLDQERIDICFWGDVSFQHIFQLSKGCPTCHIRYYSATIAGHVINHGPTIERLLQFMIDPSILEVNTIANILKDPATKSCDISYYHDSVFEYYQDQLQLLPLVTSLVVLDIYATRTSQSKESIFRSLAEINPSIVWHSSAHHYTDSVMIFDLDSNGFVYRKMGTNIFMEDQSNNNSITLLKFGFTGLSEAPDIGSMISPISEPFDCPAVVISYTNRVFYETALGFYEAIKAVGISSVEIWGDMLPSFGDKYIRVPSEDNVNLRCPLPLQIAIAPHEDSLLLPHYIVLHMEQTWSPFSVRDVRYKQVVENAVGVWLMSWNGIESFSGLSIDSSKIFVIPLYTRFDYAFKNYQRFMYSPSHGGKTHGVCMLGSHSQRREEIIAELHAVSSELWGAVSPPSSLFFSRERDIVMLRDSKIVLNIHGKDDSSLEVHRINTLLAHGCCVISERGSDPLLTEKYEGVVVFSSREDLATTVLTYLNNEEARRSMERKALQFALNMQNDLQSLEDALILALNEKLFSSYDSIDERRT